MDLLETKDLSKSFGKREVVKGVNLTVRRGEVVGLLGPNGAGKTTTFRMILGMIRPDRGQVFFDGHDVSKHSMCRRARAGMGYLPQETAVFQKLSVEDNIMAILETMNLSRNERRKRLAELLQELQLTPLARSKAYNLSGGEKRRLEITRALATEPSLLFLDEPFAAVDPKTVDEIQDILEQLKDRGISILITDHKVHETLEITDRSYIIHDGVILVDGPSDVIRNDPAARRVYLGQRFSRRNEPVAAPAAARGKGATDHELAEFFSDGLDARFDLKQRPDEDDRSS